jgi:hypothetical protein
MPVTKGKVVSKNDSVMTANPADYTVSARFPMHATSETLQRIAFRRVEIPCKHAPSHVN